MTTSGITNQLGHNRIIGWILSIIDGLFATVDHSTESTEDLEFATARATQLFAQALHENSNLEMDWLWYAANMRSVAERRYCLHHALAINPHSGLARSALAKLPKPAGEAGQAITQSPTAGAGEPA
jgi:hypothetical protein